jgi:hypothetical protein
MNGYKPVECQDIERDEPKEKIFPCHNWLYEHKCCKGLYDFLINGKYEFVNPNENDLDKDCKLNFGKSNALKCVYYLPAYLTEWKK